MLDIVYILEEFNMLNKIIFRGFLIKGFVRRIKNLGLRIV